MALCGLCPYCSQKKSPTLFVVPFFPECRVLVEFYMSHACYCVTNDNGLWFIAFPFWPNPFSPFGNKIKMWERWYKMLDHLFGLSTNYEPFEVIFNTLAYFLKQHEPPLCFSSHYLIFVHQILKFYMNWIESHYNWDQVYLTLDCI